MSGRTKYIGRTGMVHAVTKLQHCCSSDRVDMIPSPLHEWFKGRLSHPAQPCSSILFGYLAKMEMEIWDGIDFLSISHYHPLEQTVVPSRNDMQISIALTKIFQVCSENSWNDREKFILVPSKLWVTFKEGKGSKTFIFGRVFIQYICRIFTQSPLPEMLNNERQHAEN